MAKEMSEKHSLLGLLSPKEIQSELGVSRSRVYELMREHGFPQPLRLGPRTRRWRVTDVQNWIEKQEGRNDPADKSGR